MLEEIRRRTDTEYKEIDNICYQHLDSVYSAKKSSNSIENIDYLVDRALAKNKISSHYDKVRTRCPKIKLQRHKVNRKSLSIARKKALAVILSVIILSVALIPIITSISSDEGLPADIDILNVQSYPVIGGNWVVKFTTIGCDNLTITAVNGTKWSNVSKNYDLKFLGLKRGNEILEYEWMNDSVFIANYSSKETTYEVSQVFTPGVHTLMFQFGDHVAFANNLALEYWLQTTTSDFNNGTINNINVSSDAFHLNETFYLRNTSLIDDESFEGSWPPSGWSETGNWNRENNQAYDGSWSADFDGLGGGRSGDLDSPTMDCSDTVNITAIYVDFYYRDEGAESGEFVLYYYDGSGWDYIEDLADDLENNWNHYTGKIIDSQYFKNNFQIRWSAIGVDNGEHVYVDLVNVTLEKNISGYVTSGSLISEAHNTTRKVPMYNSITVDNSTPGGASIATWIRAADTQANLSSATWYTDISQVPYEMWVQWRINLTGNEDNTSTVNEVNLSWNYDDEKPTSSVDVISPYWQNTTPLTINATVLDTGGSGLNNVTLYWYNSTDNSTWSGPWNYGTDSASPWSWSFNFTMTNGTGYYRFYSIARDNESNVEDFTGNDTSCGYDNVKPSSVVDDISPYWYNDSTSPLTINVSSATDDLSGVKNVTLYYRFREDNGSGWGSWTSYSVDESLPWSWSFNFPDSTGHYQFYSIATDNTSNKEDPPVTPDNDTYCGFNSTKPTSEVDTISPYWQSISPLPITAQATDYTGTGLKNVTLYYYNSTDNSTWYGNWTFGVDTDPWNGISWSFNFPNSSGYYRFYSIAIDNNSNIEYFTGNDTICGYDTAKPSSQVDPISPYWQNSSDNPLTITVTGPSDDLSVKNISLNYRYRADNGSGWNSWTSYGVDENSPWSWSFNFPSGEGHYQFYSRANDTSGKQEDPPSSPDNDTDCGYDTAKPSSQVDPISPYWKGDPDNPLNVTVTGPSDALSGVKNITLYYRYRVDNGSGWGSWTSYGVDENSPWSWSFNFPDNTGHYQLYSIAIDNASNQEDAPVTPDNDTGCGYTGPSFNDSLWSESNYVSSVELTLTSSANADGPTTGTWADANGKWSKTPYEYWEFVIENLSLLGPINNATLYMKHYQSGWVDDSFMIQIWDGSSWLDVQSYTSGSGPPAGDTLDGWDVKALGIDDWRKVNAAIVRIIGNGRISPEDTVDWFVDTVELRVDVGYPKVPVINSYDLRNATGSKLNNATGLVEINNEYYFTINITDENGWEDIEYINITAWYDNGNDGSTYNQTQGGNLNMFLQYENLTGNANWTMLWPDDEATLILANCSETIINSTTRVLNFSFRPLGQVRWAPGDGAWDTTQDVTNDINSWNFNITVTDNEVNKTSKINEYGVYRYTSVLPDSDWVDVFASPGFNDDSSVVTITYSSNYDFNMSIYFEENLTHTLWSNTIPIANNLKILAAADPNDDITSDKVFQGIGEVNAIDIINTSGIYSVDNASQTVDVQFNVYIPFGTLWGEYTARVATKINQG